MGVGLAIMTNTEMTHQTSRVGMAGSKDVLLITRIGLIMNQATPTTMKNMHIFIITNNGTIGLLLQQ
jgi:hypothetical protein